MAKQESEADLQAVRQALGIGNDVTDSALRLLLSSKSGQDVLKKAEAAPKESSPGLLDQVGQFFSNVPGAAERTSTDIAGGLNKTVGPGNEPAWIAENVGGVGLPELIRRLGSGVEGAVSPSTPTPPAKKPAKTKPLPSPQAAAANQPESPFQQLAQSLASEYLGQVQQLMPLTSGSGIFGAGGQTNATVNQAAAAVPGAGGWLQQQAAAEQQAAGAPPAGHEPGGRSAGPRRDPLRGRDREHRHGQHPVPRSRPVAADPLGARVGNRLQGRVRPKGPPRSEPPRRTPPPSSSRFSRTWASRGTASGVGLQAPGTAAKGGTGSTTNVNTPQPTGTP